MGPGAGERAPDSEPRNPTTYRAGCAGWETSAMI
jgi:hypothetical protein